MKRIVLLYTMLVFAVLCASADVEEIDGIYADEVEINGIYYNFYYYTSASDYNHTQVTSNPNKYSGEVVIPNSVEYKGVTYIVTSILEKAFAGCSGLTSVTIPNSVTSIGNYAFSGCSGLASVTIPNSVTSIGNYAFSGCSGLTSVNIPNSITSIGSGAFYNCSALTSITIPNSVAFIDQLVFMNCTSLTSITIPNSVSYISYFAFDNCNGLTSVTIPNSVTTIKYYAFIGCTGLTSITIPNSVTSIDHNAFEGCSGMKFVSIGSGMKSIGEAAFANCSELTDVYCMAETVPSAATDAFKDSYIENATLHVPAASLNDYKNKEPWSNFQYIVAIGDGDIPEKPKCAKPEINFVNGKVSFSCETEGVEYISEVTLADEHKYYDTEIQLSQTYKVSVYATKTGYDNSDVTTREIVIKGDNKAIVVGDVNGDGVVNAADHVKLSDIIMEK